MIFKLLSSLHYYYKKFTTPPDYYIISEEIEYKINYDMKYLVEDEFWRRESKDWDGILEYYYSNVTNGNFRHTSIPQNVENIILRIKYYFNGREYTVVSNDINFKPVASENKTMRFNIPVSSAWIVDHDDKPLQNITDKVKRYSGPGNDFHGQKVPIEDFLYYDQECLKERFPKILLINGIGLKKTVSTVTGFTTDLQIP
tara:strand:+ start:769 stop:1368 length:600 start_codon:yes stop_codon:yes gene_type:complete